jgi:type IV fimbrial biogenesis protein FimT
MRLTRRSRLRGVTLIELLVTLSVIAILLTLGVGAFRTLIANAKMTNAANSLIGHLQFARSEAVKRNLRVEVCPSEDGSTCSPRAPAFWQGGYMVAVVNEQGGLVPPVLRRVDGEAMQGVTVGSGSIRGFIYLPDGTAQPDGMVSGTQWAIKICDPRDAERIRQVAVNAMGRTYVQCNDPALYTCPATCP